MGKWFDLSEVHNKRSYDFRRRDGFFSEIPIIKLIIAFLILSLIWGFRVEILQLLKNIPLS